MLINKKIIQNAMVKMHVLKYGSINKEKYLTGAFKEVFSTFVLFVTS